MNAQQLLDMIEDKSVSDEILFDVLKDFLADKKDVAGNNLAPTGEEIEVILDLSRTTRSLRPALYRKLYECLMIQHGDCCGGPLNKVEDDSETYPKVDTKEIKEGLGAETVDDPEDITKLKNKSPQRR